MKKIIFLLLISMFLVSCDLSYEGSFSNNISISDYFSGDTDETDEDTSSGEIDDKKSTKILLNKKIK